MQVSPPNKRARTGSRSNSPHEDEEQDVVVVSSGLRAWSEPHVRGDSGTQAALASTPQARSPPAAMSANPTPRGAGKQAAAKAAKPKKVRRSRTYQCVCGCGPLTCNIYKVKKRNTTREGFAKIVAAVLADVDGERPREGDRVGAMHR